MDMRTTPRRHSKPIASAERFRSTRVWIAGVLGLAFGLQGAERASAQVNELTLNGFKDSQQGVVVNFLDLAFDGRYEGAELVIRLNEGSIVGENSFGRPVDVPPRAFEVNFNPELFFDTYFAQGARTSDDPNHIPGIELRGGATNIWHVYTDAELNDPQFLTQAWGPTDEVHILDRTHFTVAQIGLTDDAEGWWEFYASAAGTPYTLPSTQGVIMQGTMSIWLTSGTYPYLGWPEIPEPSSAAIFACGSTVLLFRRHATRSVRLDRADT
ncbi:MAG: hypothetical protein AAF663_11985 [Planctomycetota bacterium]